MKPSASERWILSPKRAKIHRHASVICQIFFGVTPDPR